MKVTLRQRESKRTNRITLYIEIYLGYTKDAEGRNKAKREYEYLEYYLISNPKTLEDKHHNKENLKGAEAVRAKILLDLQNNKYGFETKTIDGNVTLFDYFEKLLKERHSSIGNYGNWDSSLKHLTKYCKADLLLKDVGVSFCEGFKNYLELEAKTKSGKNLSNNSALSYFNKFRAVINQAYDEGLISKNPLKRVKGVKQQETHREYLTLDELKSIIKAECRYDFLKNAFIFSCLTGLRWSDINKLKWSEIYFEGDSCRLHFTQKKTKGVEYLDISKQAQMYMGNKGKPEERVFNGLKYSNYVNTALMQWMLKAGITKHITFHCARHTFATLQLTLGTDIYTVSKLLGHSELKTTQVYAKIIDQQKREAMNRIPDLLS